MTLVDATPYLAITTQEELGDLRSAAVRYRCNMEALSFLRQLQAEGRAPGTLTRDEQLILARYSAFGESEVLNRAFKDAVKTGEILDEGESRWTPTEEMAGLTSEAEQAMIKRTARTAFYTPINMVRTIWEGIAPLGLRGLPRLRMIETSSGIGHFINGMPADLREKAEITLVEIDPVTAQMVAYLHPDATVYNTPFQKAELPEGYYDLAISNVPFSAIPVADRRYDSYLTRTLHDYFFAKAMRLVRPGGIVCFLTSFGTLDKREKRVRSYLAQQGRLLGAYRLPNGVFKDVAGTESGTDLIILQRYLPGETPAEAPWIKTVDTTFPRVESKAVTTGSFRAGTTSESPIRVNAHLVENPARIIGTPLTMYKPKLGIAFFVEEPSHASTAEVLAARMRAELPMGVVTPAAAPAVTLPKSAPRSAIPTLDELGVASTLAGGDAERAKGMLTIYQAAKGLIRLEVMGAPVIEQERARKKLNEVYDAFVKRYGALHARGNRRVLKDMPELSFLLSLESDVSERGGKMTASKAHIFTRATIRPERAEARGLTAKDALLVCLDEIGRVDLERIARTCGMSRDQVLEDLKGILYRVPNPDAEVYETADQYLSGNIREKLRHAKALSVIYPEFGEHIPALEAALPTPLTPGEIIPNLGATWIAPEDVEAFIVAILPEFKGGSVDYNAITKRWEVKDTSGARWGVMATTNWGTKRVDAIDIIAASLNGKLVVVQDTVEAPGGGERRVTNEPETMAAQDKQGQIKEKFASWLWEDAARAERLAATYNERYNSVRLRQYDGSHLSLPGMNTAILRGGDLSGWQKDAIWQILQSPATLIGHVVGAGKTFELIAAAREAKRMGLVNKPMVVVPNHLVEQWAKEATRLYPGMKVLAMSPEDFAKERRGRFLSMIATGDWDLVIVAHTSFKSLPVSAATMKEFMGKRIAALRAFLEDIKGDEEVTKRTIKEVEGRIEAYEAKLDRALEAIERDDERTITWDELGVDMLMVDEAHEFKNLEIETRMDRVAGVPRSGSQRAFDMWIKTWDLKRRGGKVVFATGTPVANTLAEVFVFMRYLQEDLLEELGIEFFDSWVASFAQTQMAFEMRPDGSGFRMNTRLSKFVNLPELATLWRQCLNVRTAEQLNLPRPKLVTGKPIPVISSCSPRLKLFVANLVERVEKIKLGAVDPTEDNMLKVTGDGRKAALDIRLVQGGPEEADCKINNLVRNLVKLYTEFDEDKGVQLVFCDQSTPKGSSDTAKAAAEDAAPKDGEEVGMEAAQRDFVYHEIRQKLMDRGIPREEIAFIHEYNTKTRRDQLFTDVRAGRVRILIGSTAKMGTGMNVQDRLIALHHLDAPWRPCDIEQREGRILRQGNRWPEVFIFQYVTEGSFDGYIWQLLENKARFISHIMAGEVTARTAEDIAEVVLTAAEIKAIASGNPKILEKVKLEAEIGRLDRVRGVWVNSRISMRNEHERIGNTLYDLEREQERLAQVITYRDAQPAGDFSVTVHPVEGTPEVFTKREEAGKSVRAAMQARFFEQVRLASTGFDLVGTYRGFTLQSRAVWSFGKPTHAALYLECAIDGRRWLLNEEPLATTTDMGVFTSVDATLRNLERNAESLATRAQRLRDRDAEILTELAKPWDGEAQYKRMSRTLARLDRELAGEEVPPDEALSAEEEAALEAEIAERAATPALDVDALLAHAGSAIRPVAAAEPTPAPVAEVAAEVVAEAALVADEAPVVAAAAAEVVSEPVVEATALTIPVVDVLAVADEAPVIAGAVTVSEPTIMGGAPVSLSLFGNQAAIDSLLAGKRKGKGKGKKAVAAPEGQLSLFGEGGVFGTQLSLF